MTQTDHTRLSRGRLGIVLAAFGTAVPAARTGYALIEARVRAAYPETHIAWAFTSAKIRQRLRGRPGAPLSVAEALDELAARGVTRAVVQSLHTVPGEEFRLAEREAEAAVLPGGLLRQVAVGAPLLCGPEDIAQAAAALPAFLPGQRAPGEAVVLIGHGTSHAGRVHFEAFHRHLRRLDPDILFGTLTGAPGLPEIVAELVRRGVARAWLTPFMSVAGYHVREDIAGARPGSWARTLAERGITPLPVVTGTTAHPGFVTIWLAHLAAALARLSDPS